MTQNIKGYKVQNKRYFISTYIYIILIFISNNSINENSDIWFNEISKLDKILKYLSLIELQIKPIKYYCILMLLQIICLGNNNSPNMSGTFYGKRQKIIKRMNNNKMIHELDKCGRGRKKNGLLVVHDLFTYVPVVVLVVLFFFLKFSDCKIVKK